MCFYIEKWNSVLTRIQYGCSCNFIKINKKKVMPIEPKYFIGITQFLNINS